MMRPHWHQYRRHHRPPPFVRRLGCLFATLVALTAAGIALLTRTQQVVIVVVLIAAFFFVARRVSAHFIAQSRLRRQLMADVAHELRTPLAILQGRIEGLIDGVYPRDDEHLEELLDKTQHLGRLVEDLRLLANAEAGALDLQKEDVDLGELIRDAASSFDRVAVHTTTLIVHVDPVRIREVLLNLLTNATQHAPSGPITITAEPAASRVIIRVTDTGPGIPLADLPHIFDRFRKGSSSSGSGLGLAIARTLVHAHGGTIEATSELGRGTTITVALPK